MKRAFIVLAVLLIAALALMSLLGCAGSGDANRPSAQNPTAPSARLRIGTLPLEDLLPVFVTEQEGLLEQAGLDVEYIVFQSAQEQIAAMTAGEIDAMTADMIMLMMLNDGGTPVKAVGAIQGGPAGIIAGPKTSLASLADLQGVPIAASSATCIEYIVDKTLADAGVPQNDVRIQEIKKIPVRYEMLMSGQSKAAALPWPFFALAQSQGGRALANYQDTSKYSTEVLAVSDLYMAKPDSRETIDVLMAVWDQAVELINKNPESYRQLLITKARLPQNLPSEYVVRPYPPMQTVDADMVADMNEWAVQKKYLDAPINYEDLVLSHSATQ